LKPLDDSDRLAFLSIEDYSQLLKQTLELSLKDRNSSLLALDMLVLNKNDIRTFFET